MSNILKKNKYGLIIFAVFCARLLIYIPSSTQKIEEWTATYYVMSYELGFSTRFLMGTIVRWLTGDAVTLRFLYWFWVFFTLLMVALVARYFNTALLRCEGRAKESAVAAAIVFAVIPSTLSCLFSPLYFGRLDVFLIILAMLAAVCAEKNRLIWLIPPLCLTAMLVHQVFFFMLMPFISILLLYRFLKSGREKKYGAVCAVTYAMFIVSFVYLQFISSVDFSSPAEMAENVGRYAVDFNIPAKLFDYEYFMKMSEHVEELMMPSYPTLIPRLICSTVISAPVFISFLCLWKKAATLAEDKQMKLVFLLCAVAPVAVVPSFILTLDWDRWFMFMLLVQFFLLFALVRAGEPAVLGALGEIRDFFAQRRALCLFMLVWLAFYSAATRMNGSDNIRGIFDKMGL